MEEITILRKRPRGVWERITIPNRLDCFQDQVGGFIESVTFMHGCTILCNEEGRLLELEPNPAFQYTFAGTILLVGVDGDEFCDVPIALLYTLEGKR